MQPLTNQLSSQDHNLAELYAKPSQYDQILEAVTPGLNQRYRNLIQKYSKLIEQNSLHDVLSDHVISDSPKTLFRLTHSSFEFALGSLAATEGNHDLEKQQVNQIHALVKQAKEYAAQKGISRNFFTTSNPSHDQEIFPRQGIHEQVETCLESEILESAMQVIREWDEKIIPEVDTFIIDYLFWWTEKPPYSAMSLPYSPGHVTIAPYGVFGDRKKTPQKIQAIKLAAAILHESRHQKGYFLNRALDPRPDLYPTPFVKDGYEDMGSSLLLDHPVQNMLDILTSVGFDFLFLKHILDHESIGEYYDEVARDCAEKKEHIVSVITCAEMNREILTPLGELTLETILDHFGF